VGAWKALVADRIDSFDQKWGDNTGWQVGNDRNRYFVDYSGTNQCFEGGDGRCFSTGVSKGRTKHKDMMLYLREEGDLIVVGDVVQISSDEQEVRDAFQSYKSLTWADQMKGMLGKTFPVLGVDYVWAASLPSPDGSQGGEWHFPISILTKLSGCVSGTTVLGDEAAIAANGWTHNHQGHYGQGGSVQSRCTLGWWGYNGGDNVGAVQKNMVGSGTATLTYGNCWNAGVANLYLNKVLIDTAPHDTPTKAFTFKFNDGDLVELKDESGNAVVQLISIKVDCTVPDDATTVTKVTAPQWSLPLQVKGRIECIADIFGEKQSFAGAQCVCTPTPGVAETFATLEDAEHRCTELSDRGCIPPAPTPPTELKPTDQFCTNPVELFACSEGAGYDQCIEQAVCTKAVGNDMRCGSAEADRWYEAPATPGTPGGNACICFDKCGTNAAVPDGSDGVGGPTRYRIPATKLCATKPIGLASHGSFARLVSRTCPDAALRAAADPTIVYAGRGALAGCRAGCLADAGCTACAYLCNAGNQDQWITYQGPLCDPDQTSTCGAYLDVKTSRPETDGEANEVRSGAIFDLDAATQTDGRTVKDSVGGVEWTSMLASTFGGMAVYNLDNAYLQLKTAGAMGQVSDEYTHVYWVWWRETNAGWRSLFRGINDHCALVKDGTTELGFFSNRNGNAFYGPGGNIQTSDWTFLAVTGSRDSESADGSVGLSTFYMGTPSTAPTLTGSAPRVCSGTSYSRIAWPGQGGGKLAIALVYDRVLTVKEINSLYAETKIDRVCVKKETWCTHVGSTYAEKDCDGDGVPDPTCSDTAGNFGVLMSSAGCADSWPTGECLSTSCGGVQEHKCVTRKLTDGNYFLEGSGPMDSELIFQAPGFKLPLSPGELQLWYGEDRFGHFEADNSGTTCADVYVLATSDEGEWTTVFSEEAGSGHGLEFDGDALHLLDFPELEAEMFASGDYYVRLEWSGNQYFQFHVPASADIFKQAVRCAFSNRILHLRMPLHPTPVRLKRTCV
jgi:hypothetical protein